MLKNRNPTPKEITQYAANYSTLGVFIITFLYALFTQTWQSYLLCLLTTLVAYLSAYNIFSYYLKTYIYRKIKVIYKSIHSLKMPKNAKTQIDDFDFDSHIIDEVEKQVIEWAMNKREEDARKAPMDNYRRNLLGNISHELKTPIFNIQGYLLTLVDGAVNDERVNMKYIKRAVQNLDRLHHIVEDLDVISQIEGEQLEMEHQRFDIHKLALNVFEDLELKAQKKSVNLRIKEGCNRPFFVDADRERIRQVLDNLVNNAIKYGKEAGYVQVSFYDMDSNLLIEVSDNGIGISNKHLPRLFERFYRVDKARSREAGGTGLGLSIVKHIIEAHNQTINVRSGANIGSTFGFTLEKAILNET
jgi:two-component system phosphate regulon sensor histidine kinase PhoR